MNEKNILNINLLDKRIGYFVNERIEEEIYDNDKYKDDVFVAVNGVGMIVPRGVEVKIPRKYAEALFNSEQQNSFAAWYQAKLQSDAAKAEAVI